MLGFTLTKLTVKVTNQSQMMAQWVIYHLAVSKALAPTVLPQAVQGERSESEWLGWPSVVFAVKSAPNNAMPVWAGITWTILGPLGLTLPRTPEKPLFVACQVQSPGMTPKMSGAHVTIGDSRQAAWADAAAA